MLLACWYPAFGLMLRPEIAALSMSGSSIIVAVNALALKRLRFGSDRPFSPELSTGCPDGWPAVDD
jgi:P-type Cu2+ transporter